MKIKTFNLINYFLIIILIIFSILEKNMVYFIVSLFLLVLSFFYKKSKFFDKLNKLIYLCFLCFLIISFNEKETKYETLNNKNLNYIKLYSDKNKLNIHNTYEFSDIIKKGNTISYNIDNNNLYLVTSSGINYNKKIILPSLINKNYLEISKFVQDNYLNNIVIKKTKNDNCKNNTLISQNKRGTVKRNEKIVLNFCVKDTNNKNIDIKKNDNKYAAIIKLSNMNIKFKEKYEFNNIIEANHLIRYENNDNKVILYISKGEKVQVPNLAKLSNAELNDWILKNDLNVEFEYIYSSINKGKIVKSNISHNELISSLQTVKIYYSKGPLILPNFSNIKEFKNFAEKNNIDYKIKYQYSNLNKDEIIKYNINPGTIINNKKIIVYISKGIKKEKKERIIENIE